MVQAITRRTAGPTIYRTVVRKRTLDSGVVAYDRRWRAMSEAFLQEYPFCVLCLCHGKVNECIEHATNQKARQLIVDHIIPHEGNATLFYDQSNWETLGTRCHNKDKRSCEMTGKDWFAVLRAVIKEKETTEFLREHERWIPAHVMERLQCA